MSKIVNQKSIAGSSQSTHFNFKYLQVTRARILKQNKQIKKHTIVLKNKKIHD